VQPDESVLADHPFFDGMQPEYRQLISGCAANGSFAPGEFILREGDYAATFYLIRHGQVAVEAFAPGHGPITVQTLGDGDLLGWSWLFPPYRWHFDARALAPTEVFAVDGACLRLQCEEDPALGYALMKRLARTIIDRLQAARLQLMNIEHDQP
jgi:CRP-like cAMP-binding protein